MNPVDMVDGILRSFNCSVTGRSKTSVKNYVRNMSVKVYEQNPFTVVVLADGRGNEFAGFTKCCPEDKFNATRGLALAQSRALRKAIAFKLGR